MDARAAELIAELDLAPHPEGGYFRRWHCAAESVRPLGDERVERPALTAIFFLLEGGSSSCWHRVRSDETWHFYEGAPLELFSMDADFGEVRRERLGPVGTGTRPARVIPANQWQAARSTGAFSLVGCSVGPGFDFDDFQMLRDLKEEMELFRRRQRDWMGFL